METDFFIFLVLGIIELELIIALELFSLDAVFQCPTFEKSTDFSNLLDLPRECTIKHSSLASVRYRGIEDVGMDY